METLKLSLSHIAFAVNEIDDRLDRIKEIFNVREITDKVEYEDFAMNSKKVMLAGTEFEYMEPAGNGVISKFIDKNNEGFHHLAFKCNDIKAFDRELEKKGVAVIKEEGDDIKYLFIHPKETGGLLIEVHQDC